MRRWLAIGGLMATCALLALTGVARTDLPNPADAEVIPPWVITGDYQHLAAANLAGSSEDRVAYLQALQADVEPATAERALDLLVSEDFANREEGERLLAGTRTAVTLALKPQRDADVLARLDRCAAAWRARVDPLLMGAIGRALVREPVTGAVDAVRAAIAVITDPESLEPLHMVLEALGEPDEKDPVRAAFTKVRSGDQTALRGLIEKLDSASDVLRGRVLEYLYRVADDDAPGEPWLGTPEARGHARDAWLEWADTAIQAKRPSFPEPPKFRDRTLVVLLDLGQVIMLDSADKPLWVLNRVDFPLDAEPMSGGRVLLAENQANRVTIRSRTGAIVWEHAVTSPLVAQAVEDGRIFVATRQELFEVDRSGRRTRVWQRPEGETYMRASRLEDGGLGLITFRQRFIRLDAEGRSVVSFPVFVTTSGGRIDVAADGRVLVPMMTQDRVVEYDAAGVIVRSFSIIEPIVAKRLASGHVMVTSMEDRMAAEFDAAGRRIWELSSRNSRLTRAIRH